MIKPGIKQQLSLFPLWIVEAKTMPHFHETIPCTYWVLTIFAVLTQYWPRILEIGSRSRLQRLTGVIFKPWKVPARDRNIFHVGISQAGLHLLCTKQTVVIHFSSYLLVFGSPVAAYLNLQSKPEDRDEKMGVKCSSSDWCSLEQAIFGYTGLPVCLHHIRGPQTLPVLLGHAGRVDIHPFF